MKSAKNAKLKNIMPKKVVRVILWIILGFIMLRGIVSMVRPNETSKMNKKIDESLQVTDKKINIKNEVNSFAANFAKEFLTFKQDQGEEYKNRLANYMYSKALMSVNTTINANLTAIDATTIKTITIQDNKFDVEVKVKVKYDNGTSKDMFLKVPVTVNQDKYVVEDVPIFIAGPEIANIQVNTVNDNPVDNGIASNIQDMLKSFFKVYSQGEEREISYYLSDSSNPIKGLNGAFKFDDISDIKVYQSKNNSYTAYLTYELVDSSSKQEFKQKAKICVENKEDRYYIVSFETRAN